jgi:hypothetical protein
LHQLSAGDRREELADVVGGMRKLLIAIYSVGKSRRPFVPHLGPQETPA